MGVSAFEQEVDRNFDAFVSIIPDLIANHRGQFALLRAALVVDYFGSEAAALAEGRARFRDGLFSVQEVTDRPVDLGFFSHAVDSRIA